MREEKNIYIKGREERRIIFSLAPRRKYWLLFKRWKGKNLDSILRKKRGKKRKEKYVRWRRNEWFYTPYK